MAYLEGGTAIAPRGAMRRESSEDAKVLVEWLGPWLSGGGSLLFMTDYDGTLTPHVSDPGEARLAHEVQRHLTVLARTPSVRLAVVSGRDLGDVTQRVAVPEAVYAGCHGLVIDGPGIAFSHPQAVAQQPMVRALGESLARRASSIQGMRVETKRLGVTVHYRHMNADGRRSFETELARALHQSHGGRLKIFHGTKAIEILPQVGWSKGHCALRIREWALNSLPQPMLSVYIGDDWTDEMAFGALVGKAITVRVGPPEMASRATYRVDGVGAVHQLLECLASAAVHRGAA
jgi:trehalose 6-phosphate phosphatase